MKPSLAILLLALSAGFSHAAAPAVGEVSSNRAFAVRSGANFSNRNFDDYEGNILVVMMMTPWCPTCQSVSQAVGDGILDFFNASSRGTLLGKNDRGIPIVSILLSTEEAESWDSVNASFASTNGYQRWGLDANADRTNPRTMLGYFRGGFIADPNLYAWGNDRRRLVVLNLVRNSTTHSYREIILNQNYFTSADNTPARSAINAIRPAAVVTIPNITVNPASSTIPSGTTATLTVTATGTTPTYQWYLGNAGTTTTPISGATAASYKTPALTATTKYWVRASNSAGSDNSTTATITVTPPPPVTTTFAQWRAAYTFPLGQSDANDDPDADGIVNLLESFHGTHPLQPASAEISPRIIRDDTGLRLIYQRARNLAGYTIDHRFSGDLVNWTTIPANSLGITIRDLGTVDEVTVTLPPGTDGKSYYQIKVTAS